MFRSRTYMNLIPHQMDLLESVSQTVTITTIEVVVLHHYTNSMFSEAQRDNNTNKKTFRLDQVRIVPHQSVREWNRIASPITVVAMSSYLHNKPIRLNYMSNRVRYELEGTIHPMRPNKRHLIEGPHEPEYTGPMINPSNWRLLDRDPLNQHHEQQPVHWMPVSVHCSMKHCSCTVGQRSTATSTLQRGRRRGKN